MFNLPLNGKDLQVYEGTTVERKTYDSAGADP